MEFEFIKNSLTGEYMVRCEMGHEVLARLFQEEISTCDRTIAEIKAQMALASQYPSKEFRWEGKEISLSILESEVHVFENCLNFDVTSDSVEDFELYSSESFSESGLEDFSSVIAQWERFIHNR
ncbi:YacL family protein [Vibrio sp. ZSDZ65]|uniref:YacL family protein n=1 Tax=Vibrio qingdaonensis TaxID=2829491 RepID=A0A9X3CT32_9VIBR|nr:YacL family protein [Vibrio qingdaonensis]MCW8347985.1 YacL family protein [Vibrio qingdaonensis]